MPQKTIRQTLDEALRREVRRDPRVVIIGEDIAGGAGIRTGRQPPERALSAELDVSCRR